MGKLFTLLFEAIFASFTATKNVVQESTQTVIAEIQSANDRAAVTQTETGKAIADAVTSNLAQVSKTVESVSSNLATVNAQVSELSNSQSAQYNDMRSYFDQRFNELFDLKEAEAAAEKFRIA